MNEANRIIVIVALTCVAFAGLCLMVSATLQPEPRGPMFGDRQIMLINDRLMTVFDGEVVEVIPVPAYEECPRRERVFIGNQLRVVDSTGKVRIHWMYECRDTARNRASPCVPNVATDMTQMPDYENPE